MVKQIDTLKKAVYKILNDKYSNKNNEAGGNRDKSSNNEVRGQNKSEDDSNSETKT
jgi:hypothetical protein